MIEVFGMTVAKINDKFEITFLETFWEPDSMFRQLVEGGLEDLEGNLEEGEKVEELEPENAGAAGGVCPIAH